MLKTVLLNILIHFHDTFLSRTLWWIESLKEQHCLKYKYFVALVSHVCPNTSLWISAAAVMNFSSVSINSLCLLRPSTASRFCLSSFMPVSQHMRFKDGGKNQCRKPLKPRWAGFLLINIHSPSLFYKSNQHDSRYECLLTQQFETCQAVPHSSRIFFM